MGWDNRPDCNECGGMWELYEITNGERCRCDMRKIETTEYKGISNEGDEINGSLSDF